MANKTGNRLTQKTKKALIQAFLALLEEKTIDKIRIKEICELADISRPTFYAHFQTKEEILIYYLDQILDSMFVEFRKPLLDGNSNFSNFKKASTSFFEIWNANRQVYALIKKHNFDHLVIDKLKKHHLLTYELISKNLDNVSNINHLNYFISNISYIFFGVLDEFLTNDQETPEKAAEILTVLFDPESIKRMAEKFPNSPI